MLHNIVLKFAAFIVAAVFAVVIFVQPAMAQTASHIYQGDVKVSCTFSNGVTHMVVYDNDGASGQVTEVRDCPAGGLKVESPYGFSWIGYSAGNVKAAINDTLKHGCGNPTGCSSVRHFVITSKGVESEVVSKLFPMTPSVKLTVTKGSAYNKFDFHATVQDVGLWTHCLDFNDGSPQSCFDGSEGTFTIPHDFKWDGGTFVVTLKVHLEDGTTKTESVTIVVPHP